MVGANLLDLNAVQNQTAALHVRTGECAYDLISVYASQALREKFVKKGHPKTPLLLPPEVRVMEYLLMHLLLGLFLSKLLHNPLHRRFLKNQAPWDK